MENNKYEIIQNKDMTEIIGENLNYVEFTNCGMGVQCTYANQEAKQIIIEKCSQIIILINQINLLNEKK